MTMLRGTIHNGQVVLPRPVDLPDGTEVTLWPHVPSQVLGIPDDDWPTEPEEVAQLLARMERVEPFEMSPQEEAEVAAWRQKVKEYTLAHQDKVIEGLFE